ncbi:Mobile element protein [Candidatus Enterovibrio escicola]|uniref:Mobile element protein n=1 Tax=Candidatus Enterovibrio escicola TaxID=1927127 RepID=A0A2A5T6E4_9GAMM|nr:Mobile element protein [Candidatus Enterovibrio escacola]
MRNAHYKRQQRFDINQLLSPSRLTLRDYNAQVAEALANVKVMNKVIRLGMPVCQQIN